MRLSAQWALRSAIGAVGCLLVLTGCGANQTSTRESAVPTTSAVVRSPLLAPVGGVRAGVDAEHLVLTASVHGGVPGCVDNLRSEVTTEGTYLYVQTSYDSPASDSHNCTHQENRDLTVAVPPLQGRRLIINQQEWGANADGVGFRTCTAPFGCSPPPSADHCAPGWIDLLQSNDVLVGKPTSTVLGCDGNWLVMNFDTTIAECQPADGGRATPTGCADSGTHTRWFAQFSTSKPGWVVVASGRSAGCADVHATVPAFPPALCEHLPPR